MLMKKFTLLILAAMVSVISFAQKQAPVRERVSLHTAQQQQLSVMQFAKPAAAFAHAPLAKNTSAKKGNAPVRANSRSARLQASAADLITSIPASAQKKQYVRSGSYYGYNNTASKNELREQSGNVTIAFDGNDVYIQAPVAGFSGNWVKGTKDGNTITVPTKQLVTWNAEYGYGAYLVLANVDAAELNATTDEAATAVTYTIGADGTITQNATSATYVLALAWTDDDTAMTYGAPGEFSTVFTPFAVPDVVTPPAGLVVEQLPMNGTLNVVGSGNVDYAATVKVGKQGSDVYMQGLNPLVPEAWAKGTLDNGLVTFPVQFQGVDADGNLQYLSGYNSGLAPLSFSYDADLDFYSALGLALYNGSDKSLDYYGYMTGMTIGSLPATVTPPAGLQTIDLVATGTRGTENGSVTYEQPVKVGIDGTDVYVQGLFATLPDAWVKGTIAGTTVTFPVQYMGKGPNGLVYLSGFGEEGPVDVVFNITGENEFTSAGYILENAGASEIMYYAYYSPGLVIGEKAEIVAAPEGLQTEDYVMTAVLYSQDAAADPEYLTLPVKVGISGADIYVQGISAAYPEGWIKGTIADGKATFAANQYMGYIENYFYGKLDFYFLGYDVTDGVSAVTFAVDDEAGTLTATQQYVIIGSARNDLSNTYAIYAATQLRKVVEKAAKPATPSIVTATLTGRYPMVELQVPTVDVTGDAMLVSKLSYQLLSDIEHSIEPVVFKSSDYESLEADMTELPWNFGDDYDIFRGGERVYLNQQNLDQFNRVGVVSIYRGGGETHVSDTAWVDVKDFAEVAAVKAAKDTLAAVVAQAGKALNDATKPFGRDELSAAIDEAQAVLADSLTNDIQTVREATTALEAAIQAHKQANMSSEEAEIAWVAAEQGYENTQDVETIDFDDYLKGVLSIGGNTTNNPKYYSSGTALRLYAANTLTLTGRQIKSVEFTLTGSEKQMRLQADCGDYAADGTTGTWTGLADTIVFSVPDGSGNQARIQKMVIVYNQALTIATQALDSEIAKADSLLADASKVYDRDELQTIIDAARDVLASDTAKAAQLNETTQQLAAAEEGFLTANAFTPVIVPEGLTTKNYLYSCSEGAEMALKDSVAVGVADGSIFIQGLYPDLPEAWVKGSFDGHTVVIPAAQFLGKEEGENRFAFGFDGDLADMTFSYDVADDAFFSTQYLLVKKDTVAKLDSYVNYYSGLLLSTKDDVPVVLPSGLTAEEYSYTATRVDYSRNGNVTSQINAAVNIAFDGTDVYLQGLDNRYVPNGWVKGTLADGKITVKNRQLLGTVEEEDANHVLTIYPFYLHGAQEADADEDAETVDIVFNYDSATGTLTTNQVLYVSGEKYVNSWYHYFTGVQLKKVVEVAATPADPRVTNFTPFSQQNGYGYVMMNIPATGTNGEGLVKSKLFYQLYSDVEGTVAPIVFAPSLYMMLTEELSQVPYSFTDGYDFSEYQGQKIIYLNDPAIDTYNKIGVKSIYTGGGESHETQVQWYTIKNYVGIDALNAEQVSESFIDLQGRKAGETTKGLLIRQTRQADGTVKNQKVVRR